MLANSRIRYSAQQVFQILKPHQLTLEQQMAVEQAKVDSPSLIVAGAGSGKTELMAVRVLWLVANGFARPDEILGLTFTRKAASELSKRIFESLLKLRDSELWPEDLDYDFVAPTISTYNSYANSLFRDFALGLGFEPESALLTDASAFQLAREVVLKQGSALDSRLTDLDQHADSLVESVLAIAASMNDNLATADDVEAVVSEVLGSLDGLPKKAGSSDTAAFAYIIETVGKLQVTPIVAKLAEGYRAEKLRLGYVDYSDQVALAELAVRTLPQVGLRERTNFTQVLLDEYQDTSFLQTRLLTGLYRSTSVFAVGDPNQSIYGWRGASAANLDQFEEDFGGVAQEFKLSTSWRNPSRVLELANLLAAPLATPPAYLKGHNSAGVVTLNARENAPVGQIEVEFLPDIEAEGKRLASWFKGKMTQEATGAVLLRNRASMGRFADALRQAGLDVEVVGLGGLLDVPEVVDLVSALKVLNSPDAGSQLIRLLAGPRWRIGVKDLAQLSRYARYRARDFNEQIEATVRENPLPEDSASIVDALDLLLEDSNPERADFSEIGLVRLRDAAAIFRKMRRHDGLSLVDFVRSVEQELWLDIEVMANPSLKHPMANLNAFASIVANYAASNHRPTLSAFLAWLDYADQRERIELPTVAPERGVVQVLTIHAAKGLEWDNVAIANLTEGDFPSDRGGSAGWLSAGELPYPLRGDHGSLPSFDFSGCESQQEFKARQDQFKQESRLHKQREELRLMYVAVTRPKKDLLLTGSYWKPGLKNPKSPSTYLTKAAEFLGVEIPPPSSEINPLSQNAESLTWPLEPLGEKFRVVVSRAKNEVEKALDSFAAGDSLDDHDQRALSLGRYDQFERDIDLLLGEQANRLSRVGEVELPVRIPASRFKDYVSDLEGLASRILRPMPPKPYGQTRAGTLFHTWVEQNYGLQADEFDEALAADHQGIEALRENFARSKWAGVEPLEVEREIQLTIDTHTFICKLDAVFAADEAGQLAGKKVEIVDWKTGASPKDDEDLRLKTLQLALYRIAYAKFSGLNESEIGASFYFVAENQTVTPELLPTETELLDLWGKVLARANN